MIDVEPLGGIRFLDLSHFQTLAQPESLLLFEDARFHIEIIWSDSIFGVGAPGLLSACMCGVARSESWRHSDQSNQ